MENSDNIENSDNTENKKEVVIAPDKEESVSLKDNKEIIKKGGNKKEIKKKYLYKILIYIQNQLIFHHQMILFILLI